MCNAHASVATKCIATLLHMTARFCDGGLAQVLSARQQYIIECQHGLDQICDTLY
jgi:hypothetical protein